MDVIDRKQYRMDLGTVVDFAIQNRAETLVEVVSRLRGSLQLS